MDPKGDQVIKYLRYPGLDGERAHVIGVVDSGITSACSAGIQAYEILLLQSVAAHGLACIYT